MQAREGMRTPKEKKIICGPPKEINKYYTNRIPWNRTFAVSQSMALAVFRMFRVRRGSWSTSSSPWDRGWWCPHRASSQPGKPDSNIRYSL